MRRLWAAVVTAIALANAADAAISSGANSAEFTALCALVELARSTLTVPAEPTLNKAAYKKLQKLNMTASDGDWLKMFHKGPAAADFHETIPSNLATIEGWPDRWAAWIEARKAAAKGAEDSDIKQSGLLELTADQRAVAAARIKSLTDAAEQQIRGLQVPKTPDSDLEAANIKKALLKAVFGKTDAEPATNALADTFGGDATGSRNTVCEAAEGANKAQTVVATMLCLCTKDQATGTADVCHDAQTDGNDWTAASAPTAAHQDELPKLCGPGGKRTLTAAYIRQKLEAVRGLIKVRNTDGYLGKTISNCAGANNAGMCIKIAGYKDAPDSKFEAIPWLKGLVNIEKKLTAREHRIAAAAAADRIITNAADTAMAAAAEVHVLVSGNRPQTESKPATANDNKPPAGCAGSRTPEECKEKKADCEWKGTEKEGNCVEKEGVKKESEGPTNTNTTGSNSFVINKAPLLLAFLLF
nr:variant surface glycoprotein [Trypanosoma brucei]